MGTMTTIMQKTTKWMTLEEIQEAIGHPFPPKVSVGGLAKRGRLQVKVREESDGSKTRLYKRADNKVTEHGVKRQAVQAVRAAKQAPEIDPDASFNPRELVEGRVYSWDDLSQLFGFEPGWLNRTGGMGSLPRHDAVLIISHPGGGKSFDYDDYWDGTDLIYTGHGQQGDQQRTGTNRYVGDNLRMLLVFEQAGPAQLRYVGSPVCVDEWPETALDRDGNNRRVIRFRLRFATDAPGARAPAGGGARTPSADPERRPRPFDASRPPSPRTSSDGGRRRDPAETAALQEKAVQAHHVLVAAVNDALLAAGWTDVGEIPAAIDLWGKSPDGARTIFEMKTLSPASELERVRSAIAQLLEYRYFFGAPEDDLCLVTDRPLSDKRVRLLRTLGIGVVVVDNDRLIPGSPDARERLHGLLYGAADTSTSTPVSNDD